MTQLLRDLLIAGNQSFASVDEKNQKISALDGPMPLFDDQFVQRILACAEKSSSIKQLKG